MPTVPRKVHLRRKATDKPLSGYRVSFEQRAIWCSFRHSPEMLVTDHVAEATCNPCQDNYARYLEHKEISKNNPWAAT